MNRNRFIRGFGLIVVLATLAACQPAATPSAQPQKASTYDRVIKAGTIRAGYIAYPPGSFKDPNTGKLTGVFVETLEEAARGLGLKVDWVEEVGWATMIEGLQSNRYDIIGTPVWANAARGKLADFSVPLYYSGIGIFVRAKESRFVKSDGTVDYAAINSADVRLSTSDGDIAQVVAQTDFPKAKEVAISQTADRAQLLLNVSAGKADVAFNEPQTAYEFMLKNPGTLKNIATQSPIRIFPNVMMFNRGEEEFKVMLNAALQELINSGSVDKLLDKYEPFKGATYRLARPYRQVETDAAAQK